MRTCLAVTVLTLLASVVQAQTARPEKPEATLGADIKQLLFDWEPAAGASYYQMYVRYPGSPRYVTFGERLPASAMHLTVNIAAHLERWNGTRYILGACNSAGCTSSDAMNSQNVMLEAIGYLKSSNSDAVDEFGYSLTLSKDGYTLAVVAPGEASSATGVNGNQADNSSPNSGAVYVYRRRGNDWVQQAYLKPGVNPPGLDLFGQDFWTFYRAVALSADGTVLAVGAPAQGDVLEAGTVYIFRRVQNTWSLTQTLQPPAPAEHGWFGLSVDISDNGRTIKVDSTRALDTEGNYDISTHIYLNEGTGSWAHVKTLEPFYAGDRCHSSRLDGLGFTIVSSCYGGPTGLRVVTMKGAGRTWVHASDLPMDMPEITRVTRQPFALNVDASWMALVEDRVRNVVGLYRWNGTQWVRAAGLPAVTSSELYGSEWWGTDLALSDDGRLLAIGDSRSTETGAGVAPTSTPGTTIPGAVYVYQRGATPGAWTLRNVVKSPNPQGGDNFGFAISLSASGRTLAVGAQGESSNARGINGDRTNNNAARSGAAYLY